MKIAITGASGFIGSNFLKLYGSKFESINILSRSRNLKFSNLNNVNVILGDICKRDSIEKLINDVDLLLHFAFDNTYNCNIKGITNIIALIEKSRVKRVVYLSTFAVYDFNSTNISLSSKLANTSEKYIKEKQLIDSIIINSKVKNIFTTMYPTIVYGQGSSWSKLILNSLQNYSVFHLSECGKNKCNSIYIDDCVKEIYSELLKENYNNKKILNTHNFNWQLFFQIHHKSYELRHSFSFYEFKNCNKNKFHENLFFDIIYRSTFFFKLKGLINKFLKNKSDKTNSYIVSEKEDSIIINRVKYFSGIARYTMFANSEIKACNEMPIEKIIENFKNDIKSSI